MSATTTTTATTGPAMASRVAEWGPLMVLFVCLAQPALAQPAPATAPSTTATVTVTPGTTATGAPTSMPTVTQTTTPAVSQTTVDISGFLNILLQAMGAVVLAVAGTIGTVIAMKLKAKYGIELSDTQKAEMEDVAKKSMAMGIMQSTNLIQAKGWDHIDVHEAITAKAAQYAVDHFPDAMANAGLDVSTPAAISATANKLDATIMTRMLPEAITTAAASPATPPAPAATVVQHGTIANPGTV